MQGLFFCAKNDLAENTPRQFWTCAVERGNSDGYTKNPLDVLWASYPLTPSWNPREAGDTGLGAFLPPAGGVLAGPALPARGQLATLAAGIGGAFLAVQLHGHRNRLPRRVERVALSVNTQDICRKQKKKKTQIIN